MARQNTMTRRKRQPLLPFLFFCIAAGFSATTFSQTESTTDSSSTLTANPDEEQQNEAREQLDELRSQISSITDALNQSRSEREELNTDLRAAEIELGQLSKQRQTTETAIDTQRLRLGELEKQQKLLQQQRNNQQQLIERQLLGNWQLSRQHELKLLLNQESPDSLARVMMYAKYLSQARLDLLNQHKTTLQELDSISSNIKTETDSLMQARLEQEKNRQALDQERQARQVTLAALEATIASQDERLKTLIRDRNALEELLKSVEEAITSLKPQGPAHLPFSERQGKMAWPAKGKRRHQFGERREDGKLRWDGVLLTAAAGSPVNAIHQGQVIFADWFRGMGLLVIVDHGDGYLSLYAHNQSLLRDTGEWVQPGDAIATVGDSGGQASSGLYFEIRHNGQPVNPALWCK
jgi:septal ring factor EnvC (AmiA/AmiB activator)